MRWFLVAGAVGLTVAVVLAIWNVHGVVSPTVLLALWPASIFGMVNTGPFKPTISELLIIGIMYGGNFLLYGLLGSAANYLIAGRFKSAIRRLDVRR